MGALIIQEVVRELLGKGLSGAKVLLLAGSRWAGQGLGWESGYGAGGQGHARREPQRGVSPRQRKLSRGCSGSVVVCDRHRGWQ